MLKVLQLHVELVELKLQDIFHLFIYFIYFLNIFTYLLLINADVKSQVSLYI